jgi:hypothetical protein
MEKVKADGVKTQKKAGRFRAWPLLPFEQRAVYFPNNPFTAPTV